MLSAGIQIKGREAKVLGVIFNCSESAIVSDAKVINRSAQIRTQAGLDAAGVSTPGAG